MIPLTTRDAADWSMICAYLRLDDEGRKRVIEEIEYQTSRMKKSVKRKDVHGFLKIFRAEKWPGIR